MRGRWGMKRSIPEQIEPGPFFGTLLSMESHYAKRTFFFEYEQVLSRSEVFFGLVEPLANYMDNFRRGVHILLFPPEAPDK
jgi:hypothetical protein